MPVGYMPGDQVLSASGDFGVWPHDAPTSIDATLPGQRFADLDPPGEGPYCDGHCKNNSAEDAGGRGVDRVEMERAEEQRSESDAADRAKSADQAALEQATDQRLGTDLPVVGVGAVEDLVEQKENGCVAVAGVHDLAQAQDLRVEARGAVLE